jgi:hypothetical protein
MLGPSLQFSINYLDMEIDRSRRVPWGEPDLGRISRPQRPRGALGGFVPSNVLKKRVKIAVSRVQYS